jgi:hypothetical protein
MSGFRITLDKFDTADARVTGGLSEAIRALAFAVQARAEDGVQEVDAIDTGALRASIFVTADGEDGRAEAVADAIAAGKTVGKKSKKPHLETVIAEPGEVVSGALEAKVGVCVNYGIYIEMGVENAFGRGIVLPARPFLLPAAESVAADAPVVTERFIKDALS